MAAACRCHELALSPPSGPVQPAPVQALQPSVTPTFVLSAMTVSFAIVQVDRSVVTPAQCTSSPWLLLHHGERCGVAQLLSYSYTGTSFAPALCTPTRASLGRR